MIYTITFNPSLDYYVSVDNFSINKTNRTTSESILPGGKGINVSIVLSALGIENTALGFIAGFSGNEIERLVSLSGIKYDFIKLPESAGSSRINVKFKNYDGTEINGIGPNIDKNSLDTLLDKLSALSESDCIILAGSIPSSIPNTVYSDICRIVSKNNVKIIIDAEKTLLTDTLKYSPFLIKPNIHELSAIFGTEIKSKDEAIPYMKLLKKDGATNVLVSCGGNGAILLDENNNIYMANVPEGELVNAVGSGDSMIAGFLAGYTKDYNTAFKMAVASGCATAYTDGLAGKEDILRLFNYLQISIAL